MTFHLSYSKLLHLCSVKKSSLIAFLLPSSFFRSIPFSRLHLAFLCLEKMSCPSLVFLRSLRRLPLSRQCSRQFPVGRRRALHTSPKSLSEEEKSFRGQLYESTARRIQAQREAEARFASMQPTSDFARNSAYTFCMHTSAAETLRADFCRHRLLMRHSLLVWNYET